MQEFQRRLSMKGQIKLPLEVRQRLGLKPSTTVSAIGRRGGQAAGAGVMRAFGGALVGPHAAIIAFDRWIAPRLGAARPEVLLGPRPGTDAALAFGLLHSIRAAGRLDRAFLAAHTEGWDEVEAKLETLKTAAKGSDTNLLRREMDEFNESLQKIGEHIYQQAGASGAASSATAHADGAESGDTKKKEEDVIDAEVVS